MSHTISVVNRTDTAYGQVWIGGFTDKPGATENLRAQLGFGPFNSNPDGNDSWVWTDAAFNVDVGNNDEFMASMEIEIGEAMISMGRSYMLMSEGARIGRPWHVSSPFQDRLGASGIDGAGKYIVAFVWSNEWCAEYSLSVCYEARESLGIKGTKTFDPVFVQILKAFKAPEGGSNDRDRAPRRRAGHTNVRT